DFEQGRHEGWRATEETAKDRALSNKGSAPIVRFPLQPTRADAARSPVAPKGNADETGNRSATRPSSAPNREWSATVWRLALTSARRGSGPGCKDAKDDVVTAPPAPVPRSARHTLRPHDLPCRPRYRDCA